MSNKQKKVNTSKVASMKQETKISLSTSKSVSNKKDLTNKIEKIGNFISNELNKYDEEKLDANDILYLKSEQLVSNVLKKNQINLSELKIIIREIVIEEIEKKISK